MPPAKPSISYWSAIAPGTCGRPKLEQIEALKAEAAYFVDCILNDKKPFNDGVAGLHVVQMLEAADQSLQTKGKIVPAMTDYVCIASDVKLGKNVKLSKFINLYGCEVGDDTKIGAFVEIQKNATIGKNCKVSSHTFICEGVTIEDDVFHRPQRDFHQRFLSPCDDRKRTTADRSGLESGTHDYQERRFDRLRFDDSSERRDRREGHRRRGQCGHQRCAANAIVAGNPARVLRYIH